MANHFDVGTTNIASIFGGDLYLAVDGRVSNEGITVNESYKKIIKYGGGIYATVCGAMRVNEWMQKHVRNEIEKIPNPSVEKVATLANQYLKDLTERKKKNVGDKPDKGDTEQLKVWDKGYLKWKNYYLNSSSFVCGFDPDGTPKIYLANGRYDVPLDISKNYTSQQIKEGISEQDASVAIDKPYPHHLVRGSYSKEVTAFIQNSALFMRINDIFGSTMDLDEKERFSDEEGFDKLQMEFAKAILHATLHDIFTGGDFIVKKISRNGCVRTFRWNLVQLYFKFFKEIEADNVLFLFVGHEDYNQGRVSKVTKYFQLIDYCEMAQVKLMGFFKGFVLHRLCINGRDRKYLELAHKEILERSVEEGMFGMSTIKVGEVHVLVGRPTDDLLKSLVA